MGDGNHQEGGQGQVACSLARAANPYALFAQVSSSTEFQAILLTANFCQMAVQCLQEQASNDAKSCCRAMHCQFCHVPAQITPQATL
jgi:hypothetical protein